MSETKESCAKKKMRYNKKTKKCLATYASCKAKNKVYNKRTRRCAPKTHHSSSSRSRSRSSSRGEHNCSICTDNIDVTNMGSLFTGMNCAHVFHVKCIDQWCNKDSMLSSYNCTCPICRRPLFHRGNSVPRVANHNQVNRSSDSFSLAPISPLRSYSNQRLTPTRRLNLSGLSPASSNGTMDIAELSTVSPISPLQF